VCGIAGFVAPPGQQPDRRVLERMTASLQHRGPDALGEYVDHRVGLGAARLRVMDLRGGDQPVANEDGSIRVVMNGEIYNFPEVRDGLIRRGHRFATRSDTEVAVHAWEEYGERCLDLFNGMFALAVWDRRREQLFLARDRMGEKPLYYALTAGWLVFGSELRAVLRHPAVPHELELTSVSRYLAFDFVPDPHCLIRGVRKLPPAHWLTVRNGQVTVQRYWDIPFTTDRSAPPRAWGPEIAARFDEAVKTRLESDVPLGCFLSGGVDSSAVAATAVRWREGLQTFSVGYREGEHDERAFARVVAARLGTRHEELVVSAEDARGVVMQLGRLLDEPVADMSFVPLYLLSRAARSSVTVALTGDGGDELFAGYPTMGADRWHERFARLPGRVQRLLQRLAGRRKAPPGPLRQFLLALGYDRDTRNQPLLGGVPPDCQAALLSPEARADLAGFDAYDDIRTLAGQCQSSDPDEQIIYRYCKLYLAGQNLANADRASMAVGLELRAPFLDHTFVEFLGGIPAHLKLSGFRRWKALLKNSLADRLPVEVLRRGKQGFGVPFGAWFRGPLANLVQDTLSGERLRRTGIFDVTAVSRLLGEHIGGVRDHRRILWALLTFELWRMEHLAEH
jgi:asparagine synthase (glutamine-hydrolysing)